MSPDYNTGLIKKEEVINWADHELLASDKPDHEVIDLSLAGHMPYSQIIGLLNTFQGNPDHSLPLEDTPHPVNVMLLSKDSYPADYSRYPE